jgi:trehalose-6-phosphatase
MTDIRASWPDIVRRVKAAERLMILSDLEGTLVDENDQDGASSLTTLSKGLLQSMTTLPGLILGICGIGALRPLVSKVGIEGLWYISNGGLDIRDPDRGETHFYGPEDVRIMTALHEQLVSQTHRLEGARIAFGGPTLALRYSHVPPANIPAVMETFRTVAQSAGPVVMTLHRPGIMEARIRSACDELSAVRYIRRHLKSGTLIAYFGQNSRTQDGLRDLRPTAIVVDSGMKTLGLPDYTLPDPSAVLEVLTRLAGEWTRSRAGGAPLGGARESNPNVF